ncbi:sulfotransferase 1B1-like isoform X2 [Ostrea edulis]|uniref:sulfotransferase 1B1-like isoform X2 n=1 Tax=Ostrea edulis TaxID=37623 RepID=UPI0024AF07DA|nr:sulfotransferase 1B1-like isoform X2 [Ostrea edulis]
MPEIKLKSDSEDDDTHLRVMDIDGYFIPTFPLPDHEKHFRSMAGWRARSDDVMISAYPKAGTHWVWEVVGMLSRQKAERIPEIKETVMMEGISEETFDNIASPRIMNTHIYFKYLPKDFFDKKCKIVYVIRNPKDIAVSFYNHHKKLLEYEFNGPWEGYVKRFIQGKMDYGSWFDYTLEMERFIKENPGYPIHVVLYEDMKEDSLREIKRLADFLKVDVSDEMVRKIDSLCHFDKMKKEKNVNEDPSEWRDNNPGMYRKGQVADWKNWFTIAQNDMFNTIYKEKMIWIVSDIRII